LYQPRIEIILARQLLIVLCKRQLVLVTAPAIVCINDLKHGNMKKRLVVAIVMLCSVVSVVRDNKPHKYGFMGEYTEVLSFDAKKQTLSVISEHMKGTEKDKQRCDINTSFHNDVF
jgi:hypothetical protein